MQASTSSPAARSCALPLFVAGRSRPVGRLQATERQSQGGSAVLERPRTAPPRRETAPKLDNGVGGGGLGKSLRNGGGGGDGGDDDDDSFGDWAEDGDDGEEAGLFRRVVRELYDVRALAAVLSEWQRTLGQLPEELRRAASAGAVSSAALVRLLSTDARPCLGRWLARSLPGSAGAGVLGRLMADPAFVHKAALELGLAAALGVWSEARLRGRAFWRELDLVVANTASVLVAHAAALYLLAPTRGVLPLPGSWASAHLPSAALEASTPLRAFSPAQRAASVLLRAAQLGAVGLGVAALQGGAAAAAAAARRVWGVVEPEAESRGASALPCAAPSDARRALGLAATFGLAANARQQALVGLEAQLAQRAASLGLYLGASAVLRAASLAALEAARLRAQGLPLGPGFGTHPSAQAAKQWAAAVGGWGGAGARAPPARKTTRKVRRKVVKPGQGAAVRAGAAA